METRDIVERLRESATASHGYSIDRGSVDAGLAGILADEAAAELSRLRAEVERLREAGRLKGLEEAARHLDELAMLSSVHTTQTYYRAASAAIRALKEKQG